MARKRKRHERPLVDLFDPTERMIRGEEQRKTLAKRAFLRDWRKTFPLSFVIPAKRQTTYRQHRAPTRQSLWRQWWGLRQEARKRHVHKPAEVVHAG